LAEVWLKAFGVAAQKWRAVLLGVGLLSAGWMLGSRADAQAVPPAQTIPEAPSLQNESLKPLDYRNKYDIYGGLASSHFNAGPALIPGANLGGFDVRERCGYACG
jgi:hypothetical protein